MMDWRIIAFAQFLIVGWIVRFAGGQNNRAMIDEINHSPDGRKSFSYIGWWVGKVLAVRDEHERLFPHSNRRRRQVAFNAILLLSFLIAFAALVSYPR